MITKTSVKNFTYQQPVKSELFYAYLSDSLTLSDALDLEYGIRMDRYHYKPQEPKLPYENSRQHKPQSISDTTFKSLTYQAAVNYEIIADTFLSYSFSTGFKAPRVEDMYFEMKGAGGVEYVRNLGIKPEKAQNHEISLSMQGLAYAFSGSIFYSKYKDFMDIDYDVKADSRISYLTGEKTYFIDKIVYKQANVDRAYIKGIEFNTMINGELLNIPKEYFATFKATYTTGNKSNKTSLLAMQPLTAVIGFGYSSPKIDLLLTSKYVGAKKAKYAMDNIAPNTLQAGNYFDKTTGKFRKKEPEPHPFLSKSYVVFDLTAGYRISKNFSINMGVFNIFNKKYTTWENLRQLKHNGNQGWVYNTGEGLGRYTAPRRNFTISFEMRY